MGSACEWHDVNKSIRAGQALCSKFSQLSTSWMVNSFAPPEFPPATWLLTCGLRVFIQLAGRRTGRQVSCFVATVQMWITAVANSP